MSVSGSESSLVASEGMSNINEDQGEVPDQQANRQKKLTDKGLEYAIDMARNSYRSKVSEWKRFHGKLVTLLANSRSPSEMRIEIDRLAHFSQEFDDAYTKYTELLSKEEAEKEQYRFELLEQEIKMMQNKVGEAIKDIESERSSVISRRSGSSKHSRCSNISRQSELAAEAAALQMKLKYAEIEAAQNQEAERLRAERERTRLKRDLDIAEAKLAAIKQIEHTESSNLCPNSNEFVPREQTTQGSLVEVNDSVNNERSKSDHRLSDRSERVSGREDSYEPRDVLIQKPVVSGTYSSSSDKPEILPTPALGSGVSESNPMVQLAQILTSQVGLSRLPPPEPSLFTGDPLQYAEWRAAFEALITQRGIPVQERFYYLKRYISGPAKEAISGYLYLHSEEAYSKALSTLERRFGDSFVIANAFRDKLESWPKISGRDGTAFRKLADFMAQCEAVMGSIESLKILNDERENQKILLKLPDWVVARWGRQVVEWRRKFNTFPPFSEFVKFIQDEAEVSCDRVLSFRAKASSGFESGSSRSQDRPQGNATFGQKTLGARTLSTNTSEVENVVGIANCTNCAGEHDIESCKTFSAKTLEERYDLVWLKRLCFSCLGKGHIASMCRQRRVCKICQRRHPTLLHDEDALPMGNKRPSRQENIEQDTSFPKPVTVTGDEQVTKTAICKATSVNKDAAFSQATMIVPVWLSHQDNPQKERMVYAMLDSQSDTTFVLGDTCKALGVSGPHINLLLSTMLAVEQKVDSSKINGLTVRGYDSSSKIKLPACYTRDIMPAAVEHIPTPAMAAKWPHLEQITDKLMPLGDFEVGLLIGYNCPEALVPRKVIPPENGGPYGQCTDLGWSIIGMVDAAGSSEGDKIGTSHRILTCEVPSNLTDTESTQYGGETVYLSFPNSVKEVIAPVDVVRMMEMDFNEHKGTSITLSQNDKKFVAKLTEGIHIREDGHYEMPLPFGGEPCLPDNKQMAIKRLKSLQNRFARDKKYCEDYVAFMGDIIAQGYAEEVPENEILNTKGKAWYIPHHGVYHPKKPGKLRVVFDCSAQQSGRSLNDYLLKGPDLTNSLIGVLLRFRQEPIAFTCDIEQMFFQFSVNPEHRDYLRFLWFKDNDWQSEPVHYRMGVHLFGATSSPGCASFALKQIASDYEQVHGIAAKEFIHRNFYVDDGLKSTETVQEAVELVSRARKLCAEGGIRLHKFCSNSREVLESVPPEDRAKGIKNLDVLCDILPVERTLGVQWCVESDEFQFRIVLKDQPFTRRGILSTISSVYDPLGFIAPVIMVGKQILQELCGRGSDWDEPVPEDLRPRWEKWKCSLPLLESVGIKRSYKPPEFGKVAKVELHHFSDASTNGYGQCSYLRLVNEHGKVHCSLLMGKSRVAPLKAVTIPRLELTAATVAVKVASILHSELDYPDYTDFYWTDSTVVLGYIKNDAKRFHIYVANRVQLIRDLTEISQWNHVKSEDNPADEASRGLDASELVSQSRWTTGPSFLWNETIPIAQDHAIELLPDDPEVKKTVVLATSTTTIKFATILSRIERFSDWDSACRAVALCMRYMDKLRGKYKTVATSKRVEIQTATGKRFLEPVNVEEMVLAGKQIVKEVQATSFSAEMIGLPREGNVNNRSKKCKNSRFMKLDPFIDSDDILRVGGRLRRSEMPYELKHPVVLPKKHNVTELLIRYAHRKTAHQGRGITTNYIRSMGFWVLGCSAAVSRYIHKCVVCRKARGSLGKQKMADLPPDRMEDSPPFTYTGVDYFGPFYVKEGRKETKRYGAIFTCLASRGIHLEVATSLSTDSFLNVLRRFISLRGPMRLLRADQGTNFVGANNELKRALEEMDQEIVSRYLLKEGCDYIEFKFSTPAASHTGGVWERQIRTVRNVLSTILQQSQSQLDDDSLRTLFYEITAIINGRPLTLENLNDPTSMEPLTPNHLLTLKTNIILPPPGNFQRADLYCRKRWRRVQYLANEFWSRWRKEYLQTLQVRQKWNNPKRNFKVGDVVIIKDEDLPRNEWKMGRVEKVYKGDDENVRRVRLSVGKSKTGTKGKSACLERPVQGVVLLLENDD